MAYELWCDSFDTSSSLTPRWSIETVIGDTPVISAANGRRSTSALAASCVTSGVSQIRAQSYASSTHVVAGFAIRAFEIAKGRCYFRFAKGTTNLVSVDVASSGNISATIAGVTYTSTKTLDANVSYHVQIGVVIGDSGSLEVRVNGSSSGWISASAIDTKPGSDANVDVFRMRFEGGSFSGTKPVFYIDDFTLTYGNELKWLGDVRVDALDLTANATPQDWTPDTGNAWERLNATAGYITGATLGDESLFELADYGAPTTAIHGVVVNASARKTDAGSRSFNIEAKSDSTTSASIDIALGDAATEYRYTLLNDPNTAAAWTDGGIDALQVGAKVAD